MNREATAYWIPACAGMTSVCGAVSPVSVIPGRSQSERTRNLEIPRCAIAHLRSGPSDHPGMTELFLRHLLDQARQQRPIGAWPQALQQVHDAGVVADQDARLVFLD